MLFPRALTPRLPSCAARGDEMIIVADVFCDVDESGETFRNCPVNLEMSKAQTFTCR